ncbi:hypothetical protein NDU88_002830 [Pleurodeles waltl]|uniref:Uncharacterized protein n=1 Tax=Pleurodeles waltl TaxID=8319 RepID=A0AAV7QCX2_PLEWA|nr:hypothetical protein NDU88_002830 [Pleurodeles waltl]
MGVRKQREPFQDVKQCLRTLGIKYPVLYPAKLKVISGSETLFFLSPKEVWAWLDVRGDFQHTSPTKPLGRSGGHSRHNSDPPGTLRQTDKGIGGDG